MKTLNIKKFKMETLQTALQLVTRNCYLAYVDLRDQYFWIPVHKDYQKF